MAVADPLMLTGAGANPMVSPGDDCKEGTKSGRGRQRTTRSRRSSLKKWGLTGAPLSKNQGQMRGVGAHARCPLVPYLRHFRDIVQKYVVTVLEIGEPSFAAFGC